MSLHSINFIDPQIEQATRGQSENPEWFIQRSQRLTASRFYDAIHSFAALFPTPPPPPMTPKCLAACQFGLDSERPAFELYKAQYPHLVVGHHHYFQPGLCVSRIYPNLAASPDFIVYTTPPPSGGAVPKFPEHAYIVEIKSFVDNPAAADIVELARLRRKYFCCDVSPSGRLSIRKNHRFYYQIIGQLNIIFCENPAAYCHLVLYYRGRITVLEIPNDLELWRSIAPRLCEIANANANANAK